MVDLSADYLNSSHISRSDCEYLSACGDRTEAVNSWLRYNRWECSDYPKVLRYLIKRVGLPKDDYDTEFDGTANRAIRTILWIRVCDIFYEAVSDIY